MSIHESDSNNLVDFATLHAALKAHTSHVLAVVSHMIGDNHQPAVARSGVVIKDSWNKPTINGTVEVVFSDSASMFEDDAYPADRGATQRNVRVLGDIGRQSAPVGGERVVLIPYRDGGWVAIPTHDEDDSLTGVSAGEHHLVHRDQKGPNGLEYQGAINAFIKLLNDGASSGDAKGGLMALAGSLLSLATGGGISIEGNDSTKALNLKAADGTKITLDGNGNISMTNPQGAKVDVQSDGSIDVAATTTTYVGSSVVLANRLNAGGATPVVRVPELQAAIDSLSLAINARFAQCAGGSGVGPIAGVGATGSSRVSAA